jgi:hypothetical protein
MSKNSRWKQAQAAKLREEAPVVPCEQVPEVEKVDFDGWYASRGPRIPRHHHKEILRADFAARGLGQCESLEDFDAALSKYGVKLS